MTSQPIFVWTDTQQVIVFLGLEKTRVVLDREEAVKAILAGLMLLAIFGTAIYYALLETPPQIQATKLSISGPTDFPADTPTELIIRAVNEDGLIDRSRNDTVRISVDPSDHAQLGCSSEGGMAWSSSLIISLEKGLCNVTFIDKEIEKVRVSVEWLDGKSPLTPDGRDLYNGWRGFRGRKE